MSALKKYIENKDFCAWALGDDSLNDVWEKYLEENPEESNIIQDAKAFVQKTTVKEPYFSVQREKELWDSISSQINTTTTKEVKFTPQWWRYGAAMLVLGLIAVFYYRNFVPAYHTEVADKGVTKNITLPDGSTINMNAESTIAYNKDDFNEEGRYIELKGEAFFQVEKGNTFQVSTEQGAVTVLGTSFNIYSRDNKWEVACYTGKVSVEDRNGNTVTLTKGQKVDYINGIFVRGTQEGKQANWQKGLFKYTDSPLEEVFKEIQRQFNVRVIYKNKDIQFMRFTGTISNKSLETSLEVIAKTMGINYNIKKNKEVEISL
ncbi:MULTISPECIES: FecR family protein [Flammeovirga]|uniref:DUF4974 domain-containing protein n=1 Tax=Flammeovirga agarivorans TaxID=2726742 RepID=A0A7X8SGA9_9BACT|nr:MULTISPECIES: FecR domain-containing protein [Flammeovirga]NLR89602.1 DUF4974 domain-containing protein [Flammeovirga agarivorans]